MDVANLVQLIALYAIPAIFAITLHEAAHGYAARHFGDPTAYDAGRISLNPIRHIDPVDISHIFISGRQVIEVELVDLAPEFHSASPVWFSYGRVA